MPRNYNTFYSTCILLSCYKWKDERKRRGIRNAPKRNSSKDEKRFKKVVSFHCHDNTLPSFWSRSWFTVQLKPDHPSLQKQTPLSQRPCPLQYSNEGEGRKGQSMEDFNTICASRKMSNEKLPTQHPRNNNRTRILFIDTFRNETSQESQERIFPSTFPTRKSDESPTRLSSWFIGS